MHPTILRVILQGLSEVDVRVAEGFPQKSPTPLREEPSNDRVRAPSSEDVPQDFPNMLHPVLRGRAKVRHIPPFHQPERDIQRQNSPTPREGIALRCHLVAVKSFAHELLPLDLAYL